MDFERDDLRLIQDLILGQPRNGGEKKWIFDIVNNKRNSVDVDKFDYILRDTKSMKLNFGQFDSTMLLKSARVVDNQICYPEKHAYEIIRLF